MVQGGAGGRHAAAPPSEFWTFAKTVTKPGFVTVVARGEGGEGGRHAAAPPSEFWTFAITVTRRGFETVVEKGGCR